MDAEREILYQNAFGETANEDIRLPLDDKEFFSESLAGIDLLLPLETNVCDTQSFRNRDLSNLIAVPDTIFHKAEDIYGNSARLPCIEAGFLDTQNRDIVLQGNNFELSSTTCAPDETDMDRICQDVWGPQSLPSNGCISGEEIQNASSHLASQSRLLMVADIESSAEDDLDQFCSRGKSNGNLELLLSSNTNSASYEHELSAPLICRATSISPPQCLENEQGKWSLEGSSHTASEDASVQQSVVHVKNPGYLLSSQISSTTESNGDQSINKTVGFSAARRNNKGRFVQKPPTTSGITLNDLKAVFHLHRPEAERRLKLKRTTFSNLSRHYGIAKWPFRTLRDAEKRMMHNEKILRRGGISPEKRQKILEQQRHLRAVQLLMYEEPHQSKDSNTLSVLLQLVANRES